MAIISRSGPIRVEILVTLRDPVGELSLDRCTSGHLHASVLRDGRRSYRAELLGVREVLSAIRSGEKLFLADSVHIHRQGGWVQVFDCGEHQGWVWARSLELALAILSRTDETCR